jgi:hypothetical protein
MWPPSMLIGSEYTHEVSGMIGRAGTIEHNAL